MEPKKRSFFKSLRGKIGLQMLVVGIAPILVVGVIVYLSMSSSQYNADDSVNESRIQLEEDVVGINIQGGSTLNSRTFLPAVVGVIVAAREGHPDVPIVVCSPVWSPPRETTPNTAGMTLEIMRQDVATAVELLRERGDKSLHYVDGLALFGPEHAANLPDELHPDAEGYCILARNFSREVFEQLRISPLT